MKIEFKSDKPKLNVKDIPIGSTFQVDSCSKKDNLFFRASSRCIVRLDTPDSWFGGVAEVLTWSNCTVVNAKVVVE